MKLVLTQRRKERKGKSTQTQMDSTSKVESICVIKIIT